MAASGSASEPVIYPDALIAAVAARPDDPLPKLLLADWCDEHGQPAG